jgi:2',3'-cyclic-nucleotide 2'-phosphodiesterase
MKILFFGDIVGKIGRQAMQKILPELRQEFKPDLVLANVENLAHGKGVTQDTLQEMKIAGIDVFTSGNHIFKKGGFEEILNSDEFALIRPANYPPDTLGKGFITLEVKGTHVTVINLMGRIFIQEDLDDPFRKLDEILAELEKTSKPKIIIVDWHAEATSEKNALGWYSDGRISAVLGTHTHIPTADTRILPKGTGFVSDMGMVGARDSILGVEIEGPLAKMKTQLGQKFEIPETGVVQVNSVYLEISEETGKTVKIERVDREIDIK